MSIRQQTVSSLPLVHSYHAAWEGDEVSPLRPSGTSPSKAEGGLYFTLPQLVGEGPEGGWGLLLSFQFSMFQVFEMKFLSFCVSRSNARKS